MARATLIALLTALAAALCAPLSAHARTPCPAEQAAPTPLNAPQVSDAIFCLSNQVRGHFGLPALRRDRRLDAAAVLHSLDMGTRTFFSHVNPDGRAAGARAVAQGYGLGVGENIAYGYSNARAAVLRWMASAGHCRNLLSSARDLGVGTAVLASGTPYYTQVLGDYFSRTVDEAPRSG
ncbi:MAG: CAP domain-containing protein, partial [Actinobacteria bacterium]|nr:CAP domain-containing protein [Actinomycetota bacterium]